jgi:hypothetical protein
MHRTFTDVKADVQLFDFEIGFDGAAGVTFKGKGATEQLCGVSRWMNG